MPVPSSATVMRTPSAASPPTPIDSVPPAGIASRALTARLTSTCSSCAGSMSTGTMSGPTEMRSAIRSLSVRSSSRSRSRTSAPGSTTCGVHDLAAAEHEQLAGERGGAVGGAADLLDVVAHRVVARQLALGEADAGEDHGQQVVEVVRDAARELSDRLQALGLWQARLELGALLGELRRRSVMSVAIVQTA